MSQYRKGVEGEKTAEEYLIRLGYTKIKERYRGQDGEIDLIMVDGDTVVFVEVKARMNSPAGAGLYAVTTDKKRRLSHAAVAFLVENEWTNRSCRFDVVEITANGIYHVKNAFNVVR